MRRLALCLVALFSQCAVSPYAIARAPGGCDGIPVYNGTSTPVCMSVADFLSTAFSLTFSGSGKASIDLAATVTKAGSCIGDVASEFCGTEDHTGRVVDMSAATTVKIPYDTTTPAANGTVHVNSTSGEAEYYAGAVKYLVPARPGFQIGGTGSDGAFTYGGQGSGSCTGSICNGGTCTGTTPTGTCTFTANSALGRQSQLVSLSGPVDTSNTLYSVVKNFTTISITAGTVTVPTPGVAGAQVILRATGDVSITGGTLTLNGKGGIGNTGGTCTSSSAGKIGGLNAYWPAGAAGASGNNAGSVGVAGVAGLVFPEAPYLNLVGAGGGACTGSGQVGATNLGGYDGPTLAGTGGGGGGCAASCSGTCGAGGRGGGSLRIETAGTYTCSGATVDVGGASGTTGGGGGGSGGVHVLARVLSTNSCTYTVTGGSAGASPPTNCGAGAAGGAGFTLFQTVPQ